MEHRSDSMSRGHYAHASVYCVASLQSFPLCTNALCGDLAHFVFVFPCICAFLYVQTATALFGDLAHLAKRSVMVGSSFRHVANNIHLRGLLLLGNPCSEVLLEFILHVKGPGSSSSQISGIPAFVFSGSSPVLLDLLTPQHVLGY